MRTMLLLLIVALAACSNSTGPKGLDPVVLAKNSQSIYPASITWWDQSGQVQQTILPGGSVMCVKFTATRLADSVRFEVVVGDTTGRNGAWGKSWSPWFDPKTGVPTASAGSYPDGAEYWTLDIGPTPGDLLMKPVAYAPC